MGQEVVTTLTIDADTDGGKEFSRVMDQAAASSERAMRQIAGIPKALQGLGSDFTAVSGIISGAFAASIFGVLDYVGKANKALAEMSQTARQTGLDLGKFQGLKFAANISGLDDSQFVSGLQRSASLLNDAQRNANSLSKEFAANGLSIKDVNGQLISENKLIDTAANLIKRAASEQDKIKIAEMLGFTRQ